MATVDALEIVVLALALAGALLVRPWRLLQPWGASPLATPLLAVLTLLPWLWSWPSLAALPIPLHWSAAPIVVLMLGWPLAVPALAAAGATTVLIGAASPAQAITLVVWSGILPATLMLVLGHAVRRAFGPNPVAYLLGRAFVVPLASLVACSVAAASAGQGFTGLRGDMQAVALLLLALGEAAWTCAIASALVACRPEWLATWPDALMLRRPAVAPARTRR
ncbi:MAG: hypothetical protein EOO24_16550 [Comamonadaceae bacterium]|nr:MAG: hypothetical protein EOO24_16550 [Comamonadaceae bacterium]